MILAAGLGTRLLPITKNQPKALVKVCGVSMLEIVLKKLIRLGIRDVVINVHHFAEMITDFLHNKKNFNINLKVSHEEKILGTGGALKKAASFFEKDEPFILHNVDVLTNLDLGHVYKSHQCWQSLATMVVQDRSTKRYLVFDGRDHLCGRSDPEGQNMNLVRNPVGKTRLLAFNGIHIISPQLLPMLVEKDVFSIIDSYLRLAGKGECIKGYIMKEEFWLDMGRPYSLKLAQKAIEDGVVQI